MQTQEIKTKKAIVSNTLYNDNPVYKIEVTDKEVTYFVPQDIFDEDETNNLFLDYINHCKSLGYEIEYK